MTTSSHARFSHVVLTFGAALLALAQLQLYSPVCAQSTEPKPGEVKSIKIADVPVQFRWIPKGVFKMGSPEEETIRYDNETQHDVTIKQGFWLAETETTQRLWLAVMGNNPSVHKGDDLPVEKIAWVDAVEFIKKANE